jgi:hypothetical protein
MEKPMTVDVAEAHACGVSCFLSVLPPRQHRLRQTPLFACQRATAQLAASAMSADEFDSWLNSTSKKPAAAAAKPAAASSWFGGASSFLGGDTASSLLGGGSSIMSALDTLQSQAKGVADSLQDTLQTQAPLVSSSLTSVTSAAGAVAGHLQQTVEEQMSQFSDEQAKFCTAEAKRAEVRDYTQAVYTVGKTIGVPPLQQAVQPTQPYA